jgi:hypothetical protein
MIKMQSLQNVYIKTVNEREKTCKGKYIQQNTALWVQKLFNIILTASITANSEYL